ncbi:hypothetical protein ACJIZ3_022980 [Penstemon smallii]|uniref:RNI-like superfamily protein n=1 Tax=Penstemon smallii TaxID=265156 RepID=A0ABD3TMS9_9LAMI
MVNDSENRQSEQHSNGEDSIDISSSDASPNPPSITRRLTQILLEEGDGDLLLQRSDREDGVMQWLSALDMQVMGACRADERLKPLLKLNVSTGVAEDRLLSQLSLHFEPAEVGMLARCLCIPLVSIRVGKISKQGKLLSPTSARGNLCLTLLPTSDLRISFNGDDGSIERLATISTEASCTDVEIEDISADTSGRSFLIKAFSSMVSYYWCSEKSKLLGDELLRKMKDLLIRKPSLAELTGISESRLNCFATRLRAYLVGSTLSSDESSGIHFPQSSFNCPKGSRLRQYGSQGSKGNLSPKPSSFKESVRTAAREKLRRRGDNLFLSMDRALSNSADPSSSDCFKKDKLSETNGTHAFASLNFLDAFPISSQEVQVPFSGTSPHYCWCPPVQYTLGNSHLPISASGTFSLPPLSSLLSVTSNSSLNLADLPPMDLPEPLARLPTSQQIPTFTPFICDPIVHVPVIDVCSSGQGYLVSAGPAISTTIPSLNPNFGDPLLQNGDSVVDNGARETLRMLISGFPPLNSNLMDPPLLPNAAGENGARETLRMLISSNSSNYPKPLVEAYTSSFSCTNDEQNVIAAGSRGLYIGTRDVEISMTSMGSIFLSIGDISNSQEEKTSPSSSSGSSTSDPGTDFDFDF